MGHRQKLKPFLCALALIASCCTSYRTVSEHEEPVITIESLEDERTFYTVSLKVPEAPYQSYSGTGTVIHSDARGTFIVTNAHVVALPPRPGDPPGSFDLPRVIYVTFNTGEVVEAGVIQIFSQRIQGDGEKDVFIDVALLYCPDEAVRRASDEELSLPGPGEPIHIHSFAPEKYPHSNAGVIADVPVWKYGVSMDRRIAYGNSGSGVYNAQKKLIGILWGSKVEEDGLPGRTGLIVPMKLIKDRLATAGLDWLID